MKSQSETAGRLTRNSSQPQNGTVLRDVQLLLADGTHALLSAVRGRSYLVMIFTAGFAPSTLLRELDARSAELLEQNARVLVITMIQSNLTPSDAAPPPDLVVPARDFSGEVHRLLGATDSADKPVPAIYITDRFSEVFAVFRQVDQQCPPQPDEIIRWLEFINYQCEECGPPEWPE